MPWLSSVQDQRRSKILRLTDPSRGLTSTAAALLRADVGHIVGSLCRHLRVCRGQLLSQWCSRPYCWRRRMAGQHRPFCYTQWERCVPRCIDLPIMYCGSSHRLSKPIWEPKKFTCWRRQSRTRSGVQRRSPVHLLMCSLRWPVRTENGCSRVSI